MCPGSVFMVVSDTASYDDEDQEDDDLVEGTLSVVSDHSAHPRCPGIRSAITPLRCRCVFNALKATDIYGVPSWYLPLHLLSTPSFGANTVTPV